MEGGWSKVKDRGIRRGSSLLLVISLNIWRF